MRHPTSRDDKDTLMDFDRFDEERRPSEATTGFDAVLERALNRRGFLGGAVAFGAAAFVLGAGGFMPRAQAGAKVFDFTQVPANSLDTVTLPKGFNWRIIARWGDPLWPGLPGFDEATRGTADTQAQAFGDNNDGMELFDDGTGTVLVVNNEYINRDIIYGNRSSKLPENPDDIRKGMSGHGVSVLQLQRDGGNWTLQSGAPLTRRITADTPIRIDGPAAGHALMKTAADPAGTEVLGTFNNCGSGRTPWGTYLTCEENFNGYFSSSDAAYQPSDAFRRYGIGNKDSGYGWAGAVERFDISKHPQEPNRFGYVVEIDPMGPTSMPNKRTALGRFKHENCEVVLDKSGHVVVYMGDDERGEFIYRYVSHGTWKPGQGGGDLLTNGTLYVAKFDDDFSGQWLALTPASTGMASLAEICIHTRQAASAVHATTMDRPEWIAQNPNKAELYCALTNNKNRGKKPNAGGDATPAVGPNPRAENQYGQIVRWRPKGGDHTADRFSWDLFVMAGNPTQHKDAYAGSKNVDPDNMFNSPDGLAFDSRGRLWIQTDGNYSDKKDFAGMGNNQMLVGDPLSGEIRRFMVGPKECEITGLCWSADNKTMFVGIQHPGEKGGSHFPGGGDSVPRSCVIAVTREDGTPIG